MLPSINLYMKVCKKETSNQQLLFHLILILANKFDQNTTDTETDKYSETVMYCDTYNMLILVLRCSEFCYCVKLGRVECRGDLRICTLQSTTLL